MKTVTVDQVIDAVKNGKVNYYNVYNLDVDTIQYNAIQYYNQFSDHDNIDKDQKLNILFTDIEIYLRNQAVKMADLQKYTQYPINAITIYSTFERIYHVYFLILPVILSKFPMTKEFINKIETDITQQLIKDTYLDDDETIKIYPFNKEIDLLQNCWQKIHSIDPSIIAG